MLANYYVRGMLRRFGCTFKPEGHLIELIRPSMGDKGGLILVLFAIGICQHPQLASDVQKSVASHTKSMHSPILLGEGYVLRIVIMLSFL